MKYEQLPEELRAELEAKKFSAVRYSSSIEEPGDKVDDAILFAIDSSVDVEKMNGYVKGPVSVWFKYVTASLSDEDALRLAEEALIEVKPMEDVL